MNIRIEIEGTTPLICNRFGDAAQLGASSGTSSAMVAGSRGTPLEQAEGKLYLGINGKPMIPSPNVFSCIIAAGTFFKAGKSKITTQKTSLIPACVEIGAAEIPIISVEPWVVDTRAVRIPSTGGRILAHRPMFHDWKLCFDLDLDDSFIAAKLFREIIDAAGKRIGLGDFRPSCKGPFGKFVVTSWLLDVVKPSRNGSVKSRIPVTV